MNIPTTLQLSESDLKLMLACDVHIGSQNLNAPMSEYVYKRRPDGVHIIDLRKTWEKIVLAARIIATYKNPSDVCFVATSKSSGASSISKRAVMKAAHYLGAHAVSGKFTPGSFTNYIQKDFYEPSVLVVADPRLDHQPVTESSYVNLPVIALSNTDSALRLVDIAIPCNNRGRYSVPLVFWLLTREVLRINGSISRYEPWEVMVDMFIQNRNEKAKVSKDSNNTNVAGIINNNNNNNNNNININNNNIDNNNAININTTNNINFDTNQVAFEAVALE